MRIEATEPLAYKIVLESGESVEVSNEDNNFLQVVTYDDIAMASEIVSSSHRVICIGES